MAQVGGDSSPKRKLTRTGSKASAKGADARAAASKPTTPFLPPLDQTAKADKASTAAKDNAAPDASAASIIGGLRKKFVDAFHSLRVMRLEKASIDGSAQRAMSRSDWIQLLLLLATLWLGISANGILKAQNQLLAEQSKVAEVIGKDQSTTSILQGFVSTLQGAGLESARERRLLDASLILYAELEDDERFSKLRGAIPVPTDAQLEEMLAGKTPEERRAMLQLHGRTLDIAVTKPDMSGRYNIAIGTYQRQAYAVNFLHDVANDVANPLRPRLMIITNQNGLFLILMSGFKTEAEALTASASLGFRAKYNGVYVTQRRAWKDFCRFGEGPCANRAVNPPSP